ncbi:MAG: DEAD/DEAH box helicase [Desulfitobacteriaceae bacterium]
MPESANKAIFELPATLRAQNGLQLTDKLKGLFSPFAKNKVILLDKHGRWTLAQVNHHVNFLKGTDLVDFLEAQNSYRLELSYISENFYRVVPARESKVGSVRQVEYLAFDFFLEAEETPKDLGLSETKDLKVEPLEVNKIATITPRNEINKDTDNISDDSTEDINNLIQTIKETLNSDLDKGKGWKKATDSKVKKQAEKAFIELMRKIDPEKVKEVRAAFNKKAKITPAQDAKVVKGQSKVPVPKNIKSLNKTTKSEEKPVVLNKLSMQSVVKNIVLNQVPVKTVESNPLPLNVIAVNSASEDNNSSVKVVFFTDQDSQLLKIVEDGKSSPVSDLFLRLKALEFSLSPGFESLMSLNSVRQIEPLDYQLRTVRYVLMNLRGRALLCDEVGMGKTVEAGLIALEYILRGLVRRVLVLAPPSLVEQWQEEMRSKFNLDFMVYDSPEFKAHPNPWGEFPRVIASIDTAKRESNRERILAVPYDLVIVDEAHHLKNERSLAYQLVSKLKKKYILLLTATPVENNLEELFNLITLLFPGQLETAASFKRKYITRGDPLKPKNTEKLKQLIREVMVRNRRSETAAIASKRSAEIVKIELSPEEMALYNRLTSFVRGYYYAEGDKARMGVSAFVLKILQREAGSSIEALLPTLEKMAANPECPTSLQRLLTALVRQAGEVPRRAKAEVLLRLLPEIRSKVIIFTGFTETQRFLVRTLRAAGWQVAELHSGLRRQEKEEQVRLFTGEVDVLVSTETGSEGRNLQFCHTMINYDLSWNPMRIEQRIGRIHRLGQQKDVRIYNFSAVDTIEAHILEILDAKINMFQLVVGELDMILGNLQEKRDFEDLIMDIWARSTDKPGLKLEMGELGDRLAAARQHYLAVKELDDRLLGELTPEE